MTRTTAILVLVLAAATAGCRGDKPESPQTTAQATRPAAAAPAPEPAAPIPEAAPAREFDVRAFAGRFATAGVHLDLRGDGTYRLDDAGAQSTGTWTHEAVDTLRLDPDSKSLPDRLFRIDATDTITPVDAGGRPAPGQPLRRQAA